MTLIKDSNYTNRLFNIIRSRGFYRFVIALFLFESVWIALSALYPQAFDENFHFGLIRIYSHHWLPFLNGQPANADAYGAVSRDPSYFFHYLMSFPYRFLNLFTNSQMALVIAMRLIDVGFVAVGLVLFRRVMKRVGLSNGLANLSLFIFILIPIVPQLAAQVNYDDLLFPMTAWICLQTFDITDQIKAHKPSARSLLKLAITAIIASIIKYAFLPIILAVLIYLALIIYRSYRHELKNFWRAFYISFKGQSHLARTVLSLLLLIAVGLFMQRAGYNLIKYHSVVPDCSKVLSVRQCSAYSPWLVDYQRHMMVLAGTASAHYNPLQYFGLWFYFMWYRLFFAINGLSSNFANNPPLLLPSIAGAALGVISLGVIFKWRARLFHNKPYLMFLLIVCLIYSVSLIGKGYATYHYTAVLENMNGRYLLPILLPLAAMAGLALSQMLRHSPTKKLIASLVVVILFLEGGGLLTFLVNSDSSWYWPNPAVVKVNQVASKVARHVVVKKHAIINGLGN